MPSSEVLYNPALATTLSILKRTELAYGGLALSPIDAVPILYSELPREIPTHR